MECTNKRILLIVDDMDINRQLVRCLQDKTTDVEYMLCIKDALDSLFRYPYCLIVIALELSETDGLSLLLQLRQHHSIPILALSESKDTNTKVTALESGADAFLAEPLNAKECRVTAQALLRRYIELGGALEQPYALCVGGCLIIDPQYRYVAFCGTPIELSRKEFDLLYFLVLHQRQVFSYEQIYAQIWNEEVMFDIEKTIRFHIQQLRKKLNGLSDIASIETVRGIGYRFNPRPAK